MNQTEIAYGFSCMPSDASFAGSALASFMFFPQYVFVFAYAVAVVDRNYFFVFASWIFLGFTVYYMGSLAEAIASERPTGYDWQRCRTSQYAVPDASFVSTFSYAIAVLYGLWRDGIRFALLSSLVFYVAPALYVAATIYTRYFEPWQALVNVGISATVTAAFAFLFGGLLRLQTRHRRRNVRYRKSRHKSRHLQ